MPALVGQRHDFAAAKLGDHALLDPHVSAGQHPERNLMLVKKFLQLGDASPNRIAIVMSKRAQLVRRADDGRDTVGHGQLGHGERIFPALGAIVNSRHKMAMDVDKRFGAGHAVSFCYRGRRKSDQAVLRSGVAPADVGRVSERWAARLATVAPLCVSFETRSVGGISCLPQVENAGTQNLW
jgi:hypothetical protein